jgi:hypothetical protein
MVPELPKSKGNYGACESMKGSGMNQNTTGNDQFSGGMARYSWHGPGFTEVSGEVR